MPSRARAGGPGRVAYLNRADLGYILLRNRNEYRNLTGNGKGLSKGFETAWPLRVLVLRIIVYIAECCVGFLQGMLFVDKVSRLIRWQGNKSDLLREEETSFTGQHGFFMENRYACTYQVLR